MEKLKIINSLTDGVPELVLRGDIEQYSEEMAGGLFQGYNDAPLIRIRINSFGGSVFSAYTIISEMQAYMSQGGEIETINEGMAGSAAGWIFAMGTRGKRKMMQFAQLFLHQPAYGDGSRISDYAEGSKEYTELETIYDNIINIFVSATSNTYDFIKSYMESEPVITAQKAVANGFADSIIEVDNAPKIKNGLSISEIVNFYDKADFKIKELKMKNVANKLGLDSASTEKQILDKVEALQCENTANAKQVQDLTTERDNLKKEVQALKNQHTTDFVNALVEEFPLLKEKREEIENVAKAIGNEKTRNLYTQDKVVNQAPIDEELEEAPKDTAPEDEELKDACNFADMSVSQRSELSSADYSRMSEAYNKRSSELFK